MKYEFTDSEESWWFDPETAEFEYEGDSPMIQAVLEQIDDYEQITTENAFGIDEHPGEVWEDMSPDDRYNRVAVAIRLTEGAELVEDQ